MNCPVCNLPEDICVCSKNVAENQMSKCIHLNPTFGCWVECTCGHPCCAHDERGCLAGKCNCLKFSQQPIYCQQREL